MMTDDELRNLVEVFLDGSFDFSRATALLGPPSSVARGRNVALQPSDPDMASIDVEWSREGSKGEPLIDGIILRFSRPLSVDFSAWRRAFGDYQEMPRLHPRQEIPYRFVVDGRAAAGHVLLRTHYPIESETAHVPVSTAILRRA